MSIKKLYRSVRSVDNRGVSSVIAVAIMTTLTVALATGLIAYTTGFVNTGAEEPPEFNPEPVVDEHGNVVIHHSDGENVNPERLKVQITVEKQDGRTISGSITRLPSDDPRIEPSITEGDLNFDNRYGAVTKGVIGDRVTADERIGFGLNTSVEPRDKVTVTVIDRKTNHVIDEETVVPEDRVAKAPIPSNFFETASFTTGSTTVIDGYKTKYSETSPGSEWSREGFSHYKQVQDGWFRTTSRNRPGPNWQRDGFSHYEDVRVGTYERIDWESPGTDWTRREYRYESTVLVGQDHKVSQYGGSGWEKGSLDHTESDTNVDYTWSESSPGYEWSKTGDTRTDYDWTSWMGWSPSTYPGDYVDYQSRTTTSTTRDYFWSSTAPKWAPSDWHYTGRKVNNNHKERAGTDYRYYEYETDTEYEYKYKSEDTVYQWKKTESDTDYYYNWYKNDYESKNHYRWTKPKYEQTSVYDWKKPDYRNVEVYEWKKAEYTTVSESFELNGDSSWTIAENVREMKSGETTIYQDSLGSKSDGPFTIAAEGSSGTWTMKAYRTSAGDMKIVADGRTIYEGDAEKVTVDFTQNKLTVTKTDGTTSMKPVSTNLGNDLDTDIGEYNLVIYDGDEARGKFEFVVDGNTNGSL